MAIHGLLHYMIEHSILLLYIRHFLEACNSILASNTAYRCTLYEHFQCLGLGQSIELKLNLYPVCFCGSVKSVEIIIGCACHRYFLLQFLGSVMHTVRIKVVLAVNLTTVGVIIYDYRITHVQKCGDYNVIDITLAELSLCCGQALLLPWSQFQRVLIVFTYFRWCATAKSSVWVSSCERSHWSGIICH